MGDHRVLPRRLRWVLFVLGLLVVGGSYAATGSEGVQVLALFVLTFGIYPAVARRFGQSSDFTEAARNLTVPFGVVAMSVAFLVLLGALIFVAAPDLGLGPWFWWWVLFWPWLELYVYLAERRLHRDGGASWKPARPLRDSVLAGVITVPVIAIITSLQGFAVGEALLTGCLCGCIVFAIAGAFTWMSRRARDPGSPGVS